jgi:cytochrome c-type biogenesis protein CcmH
MMRRLAAFAAILVVVGGAAAAQGIQTADTQLADAALEARALALHKQLRCLVCQNQSIHDSNAGLASDLRILVRERITTGDSDEEVLAYMVDRYGDWVLLKPPLKASTLALWLGPLAILIVAGTVAAFALRRAATAAPAPEPLTPEERRRVEELLRESQP